MTGTTRRGQAAQGYLARLVVFTGKSPTVRTAQRPSWRSQLGDDLAPVGGFLAGKLVSHTLLGALLGALGGAVQLSVGVRTSLQIGAGLLIIVLGLAQLGVPGFRGIVIEPPTSWMRIVLKRARSQAALAPALLGFATILIPCGVTLSVEALALTTGSAAFSRSSTQGEYARRANLREHQGPHGSDGSK